MTFYVSVCVTLSLSRRDILKIRTNKQRKNTPHFLTRRASDKFFICKSSCGRLCVCCHMCVCVGDMSPPGTTPARPPDPLVREFAEAVKQ